MRAGARISSLCAIDMEDSPFTQVTLDIFETIWQQGYRNAGVVLQSYLPRSVADARRMNQLGARVRLGERRVQGAEGGCVSIEGRRWITRSSRS